MKIFFTILSLFALSSCHSNATSNNGVFYEVSGFNSLHVSNNIDVKVIVSNTFNVEINTSEENLDDLKVYVDGKTLVLKYGNNKNHSGTQVTVSMPKLVNVSLSGSSTLTAEGTFIQNYNDINIALSGASEIYQLSMNAEDVDIKASGSSKVNLEGKFEEVEVSLSGSSDCTLTGHSRSIEFSGSGASKLKAMEMESKEVEAQMSGATRCEVNATEELEVSASGGSHCIYKNNSPFKTRFHMSGGSSAKEL